MGFVHVEMCMCVQGQDEEAGLLVLHFQVVISCLTWGLGTELVSSARTMSTFDHGVIFPVLNYKHFYVSTL